LAAQLPSVVHWLKQVFTSMEDVTLTKSLSFQLKGSAHSCPTMFFFYFQSSHAPLVNV